MIMTDHAHELRRRFITGKNWLQDRVQQLKNNCHANGTALIGEERQAARNGWKPFNAVGKYRSTPIDHK